MKVGSQISQESFDDLLNWLSPDRELAGEQYERIRQGLIRFFRFRGSEDPDTLADETINRVASKLSSFTFDKNVKTITYFYSFASNIYLEDFALRKKKLSLDEIERSLSEQVAHDDDETDAELECLEKCLSFRATGERELLIKYYAAEKSEKLKLRKELAKDLKLSPAALHTRVHRLRVGLRVCIDKCLSGIDM